MEELIRYMAKQLVDHPEKVQVSVVEGSQITVVELRVAKEDLGMVIGKRGRTADAMRTLLNVVAAKSRKRAVLEIID